MPSLANSSWSRFRNVRLRLFDVAGVQVRRRVLLEDVTDVNPAVRLHHPLDHLPLGAQVVNDVCHPVRIDPEADGVACADLLAVGCGRVDLDVLVVGLAAVRILAGLIQSPACGRPPFAG